MNFELKENFVFDQVLAQSLVDNRSPIRPLPEHFLLLRRVSQIWGTTMSLRDALKVPRFSDLDFNSLETTGEDDPFLQQITLADFAITSPGGPEVPLENHARDESTTGTGGSGGSLVVPKVPELNEGEDSDPEIHALDRNLNVQPSLATVSSVKGKEGATSLASPANVHYLPNFSKKAKSTLSSLSDLVLSLLDEHLMRGKSSRDEAPKTMSGPTVPYTRSNHLDLVDDEVIEVETMGTLSCGDKKAMSFSGTALSSSLGPDSFLGDDEDQVSSIPPSWFRPEVTNSFRYADVFPEEMEVDPAIAEEKFVPDWDVKNKDSVTDPLTAKMFMFGINTLIDHSRSHRMKTHHLGMVVLSNQAQSNVYVVELYRRWVEVESVRENLEQELLSVKGKLQRTLDTEKKVAQVTRDLATQREKIKSLTA
ncbi:hypothetical protein Hanom_Chr17g01591261 [Helianthus anomalus]